MLDKSSFLNQKTTIFIGGVLLVAGLFVVMGSWSGCQPTKHLGEDPIARVYDNNLYASDLEGLVRINSTPSDSAMIVNSYVENWVRDRLIFQIAKDKMAQNQNIDRLVEDYRAALVVNSYTESLLKKQTEDQPSDEELKAYYEDNKQLYPLEKTMVRGVFIKIDRDAPKVSTLKRWWKYKKDKGIGPVKKYVEENASEYSFDENEWMPIEQMAAKLPSGTLKEKYLKSDEFNFYVKDKNNRYFLQVKEARFKDDPIPFASVKDRIAKILIKKNNIKLVNELTEKTYRKELENKNIEIF